MGYLSTKRKGVQRTGWLLLVEIATLKAMVVGVNPDHHGDPILNIWKQNEVSRMTQADSKRKRQGMGTGRAGSPTCKVLRFNWEKIREVQRSLASDKETAGFSGLDSTINTTWQKKIILALATGRLCICEIAYVIGLSIPATSYELKLLNEQKLISYETVGKVVFCSRGN